MKTCYDLLNTINFTFGHKITGCCLQLPDNHGRVPLFDYDLESGVPTVDDIIERRNDILQQLNSKDLPYVCQGCPFICDNYSKVRHIGRNMLYPPFRRMIFEWDTRCNANCGYCDIKNSDKTSDWQLMKPLFHEIIDKNLFDKGGDILISGGEPAIIPEYNHIIDELLAYSPDLRYRLFSTLIKRTDKFDFLYDYGVMDILVSLDSACAETYKKVKGVNQFYSVIQNIQYYTDIDPDRIYVKFIVSDYNYTEACEFIDLAESLGVQKILWDFPRPDYPSSNIMTSIADMLNYATDSGILYRGMGHGSLYTNVDAELQDMVPTLSTFDMW